MEVVTFLKDLVINGGYTTLGALEKLKSDHGIKYSVWQDKLVVLNYCQIESDKNHPITNECRSLVLEYDSWQVVSRSFDRFYNEGETQAIDVDITEAVCYEKMDGSLIGLFYYDNAWLYRTRSMIMPESVMDDFGTTWKGHIETALGQSYEATLNGFEDHTFIGELTSPENRIVTKYESQQPRFTLLAVRDKLGAYVQGEGYITAVFLEGNSTWNRPRIYKFSTMPECLAAAKELRNLEEGFVIYNGAGVPCKKVKNPAYVAAHHLRGEGLTERRVLDLIIMNETDEYLGIFPEDKAKFQPYLDAFDALSSSMRLYYGWTITEGKLLTQKEFALRVKSSAIAPMCFSYRKGLNRTEAWEALTRPSQYRTILAFKNEEE